LQFKTFKPFAVATILFLRNGSIFVFPRQ